MVRYVPCDEIIPCLTLLLAGHVEAEVEERHHVASLVTILTERENIQILLFLNFARGMPRKRQERNERQTIQTLRFLASPERCPGSENNVNINTKEQSLRWQAFSETYPGSEKNVNSNRNAKLYDSRLRQSQSENNVNSNTNT